MINLVMFDIIDIINRFHINPSYPLLNFNIFFFLFILTISSLFISKFWIKKQQDLIVKHLIIYQLNLIKLDDSSTASCFH